MRFAFQRSHTLDCMARIKPSLWVCQLYRIIDLIRRGILIVCLLRIVLRENLR